MKYLTNMEKLKISKLCMIDFYFHRIDQYHVGKNTAINERSLWERVLGESYQIEIERWQY